MKKYAVIVAGGSGLRMGTQVPKQFLLLKGKPVLWYTLDVFLKAYGDLQIILVLPAAHLESGHAIIAATGQGQRIRLVTGGETRFHSVKNGLALVDDPSMVFVHDGVRCLVSSALIQRCYEQALKTGNAIPAVGCIDSVRMASDKGSHSLDRTLLRIVQTPQTFTSDIVKAAFSQDHHPDFTDEASVAERMGYKIYLVQGEDTNIKITRPLDLVIAEKILEDRAAELRR